MIWFLAICAAVVVACQIALWISRIYLRRATRKREQAEADFRFWSLVSHGFRK